MKKIYLILSIAICAVTSVNAQNFVYTTTQHLDEDITNASADEFNIDVTTTSPEAITFKWERISNTFIQDWSYSLCDYGACYVGVPASGTMDSITLVDAQNGQKGFFKINITVEAYYGQGLVEIYVYDAKDHDRGDTLSFLLNWPTGTLTGVNEIDKNTSFYIYPNPAVETLNLRNNASSKMNVSIYNVIGENIANQIISPNTSSNVDVSRLEKGIYFVTYIDEKGISNTERLLVQ